MASKIAPPPSIPLYPKETKKKRESYLAFIKTLPCVVTRYQGSKVDAAHISTQSPAHGHLGRGKGGKAADRWTLPLSRSEHIRQHSMKEMDYWKLVELDPHLVCLVLWGLWSDHGEYAIPLAEKYIRNLS